MRATPTHFALLGLLAVRPWSTYELIQYMQSSYLRSFWSKTESRLYQTPRELERLGFATATKERISEKKDAKGRQRTVYTITPAGRDALDAWLAAPDLPPSFAIDSLLKLAFADLGTKTELLERIVGIRESVAGGARLDVVQAAAENPQLPSRVHLSAHMADLLDRVVMTFLDWLSEFEEDVAGWETVASSPENTERGKRRYRALAERMERSSEGALKQPSTVEALPVTGPT